MKWIFVALSLSLVLVVGLQGQAVFTTSTNYSLFPFHRMEYQATEPFAPQLQWGQIQEDWRIGIMLTNLTIPMGHPVEVLTYVHNTSQDTISRRIPNNTLHTMQFTLLGAGKQVIHSTNEFISYQRISGKLRPDDPALHRSNLKGGGVGLGPSEMVAMVTDLGKLFDLSTPGEYLVNVRCRQTYGKAGRVPPYFELTSGNLVFRIAEPTRGANRTGDAPAVHAGTTGTSTSGVKGGLNDTVPPITGSATGRHETAASGREGGVGQRPSHPDTQSSTEAARISATSGLGSAGAGISWSSSLALLFGLLGLGVLWWLFRGK